MNSREAGMISPLLITTIVLAVTTVALGVFSIWAYLSYQDHKQNVSAKVDVAVQAAKEEQKEIDAKDFEEREKNPLRQLVSPSDLGSVTIEYPKTWSVYIDRNTNSGDLHYDAYLHPGAVPPLESRTPYAARLTVESQPYDEALDSYKERVREGTVKSKPVKVDGEDAVRLDGTFEEGVRGAMVIVKVRDKTVKIFTESDKFMKDFNNIILKSFRFSR